MTAHAPKPFPTRAMVLLPGSVTENCHSPAPLDVEAMAVDDELVEGFLRGHLGGLARGKLDEGALLPLHYGDGADLPELVEMVPEMKVGYSL